jgi:hypothetical protein
MTFQLFSIDALINILEDMSIDKPITPELKPIEFETLSDIYFVEFHLEDSFIIEAAYPKTKRIAKKTPLRIKRNKK